MTAGTGFALTLPGHPVAIDALLKKYFTLVILGLVALMAYFQASGTTELVGASIGVDASTLAQAPPPSRDL